MHRYFKIYFHKEVPEDFYKTPNLNVAYLFLNMNKSM